MRFLIILSCLFLFQGIRAQNLPYIFSVTTGTYVPLTDSISINNGETWDDIDFEVPLGFNFEIFGESTSTMKFYGNTAINVLGLPTDPTPLIVSYGADLVDRGYDINVSKSPISYKVEGLPGSRICKIEWANAGFYEDFTYTFYTNTQVWLYETSNIVELHFGPTEVHPEDIFGGFTGPVFGFMDHYSETMEEFVNMWYLEGPVNDPIVLKTSYEGVDTLQQTVDGAPWNGLIYRFDPQLIGTSNPKHLDNNVRVYPSLVNNGFTIELSNELVVNEKDMRYEIFNQMGEKVKSAPVGGAFTQVQVVDLPSGLYYVKLLASKGILATKKIMKQ